MPARTFSDQLVIDAPPSAVWKVLLDFDHWGAWNSVRPFDVGRVEVGAPFPLTLRVAGRTLKTKTTLLDVVEERALCWRGGVDGLFTGVHGFVLEDLGEQTRVHHHETFSGLLVGPILRMLGSEHASMYRTVNHALAQRVQSSSVGSSTG